MKFKVGDRVAFYSSGKRDVGEVKALLNTDTLVIMDKSDTTYHFHPKQCRKLVKKQRRRFLVEIVENEYGQVEPPRILNSDDKPHQNGYIIEVVEVKKK